MHSTISVIRLCEGRGRASSPCSVLSARVCVCLLRKLLLWWFFFLKKENCSKETLSKTWNKVLSKWGHPYSEVEGEVIREGADTDDVLL